MAVMDHIVRASTACLAVIAGALALGAFAGSATAATPCGQRVIDDWADDGRIDRVYQLSCYEQAIDGIPVDLRDYTNAADVIGRALTAAARQGGDGGKGGGDASRSSKRTEAAASIDTSGASALPRPLLVLVGVSLVVLTAGAAGHLSRRRRTTPPRESAAD